MPHYPAENDHCESEQHRQSGRIQEFWITHVYLWPINGKDSELDVRSLGNVHMVLKTKELITSPCLPLIIPPHPFQMQTRHPQPVCFTAQKSGCPSWVLAYPEVTLAKGMVNMAQIILLICVGAIFQVWVIFPTDFPFTIQNSRAWLLPGCDSWQHAHRQTNTIKTAWGQ